MWLSSGLGNNMELSVLDFKITSASQAFLACGSADEGGVGEQLGAWGAIVGAGYNIALNPDKRQRTAASRRMPHAC